MKKRPLLCNNGKKTPKTFFSVSFIFSPCSFEKKVLEEGDEGKEEEKTYILSFLCHLPETDSSRYIQGKVIS